MAPGVKFRHFASQCGGALKILKLWIFFVGISIWPKATGLCLSCTHNIKETLLDLLYLLMWFPADSTCVLNPFLDT